MKSTNECLDFFDVIEVVDDKYIKTLTKLNN